MVKSVFFGMILSLFITVSCGEYCTSRSSNGKMYCPSKCCESGDTGTFCCDSNVGLIVGIVYGVLTLLGVAAVTAALCCCPKTNGKTRHVCHPAGDTFTVPVDDLETTAEPTDYRQDGYTNGTFPKGQAINNPADNEQKWEGPTSAYTPVFPG